MGTDKFRDTPPRVSGFKKLGYREGVVGGWRENGAGESLACPGAEAGPTGHASIPKIKAPIRGEGSQFLTHHEHHLTPG